MLSVKSTDSCDLTWQPRRPTAVSERPQWPQSVLGGVDGRRPLETRPTVDDRPRV